MLQQAPIAGGGGVVEFVHHDVVEGIWRKATQMTLAPQRLDRGEQDIGAAVLFGAIVTAEPRFWADATKRGHSLRQNLFTVCYEKNPCKAAAVKGSQPRFAEPGRQHDQPSLMPIGTCLSQSGQGRILNVMRFGRRLRRLIGHGPLGELGQRRGSAPGEVAGNPIRRQSLGLRMREQGFKRDLDFIRGAFGMQVPFDARGQRSGRKVGTADNCRPRFVRRPKKPGFRVEASSAGFKNPQGSAFKIRQTPQRCRFGDIHVVAHHEPQLTTPGQQVAKPGLDQAHTGIHGKSDCEIYPFGPVNAARKQREQWITAAGSQVGLIGMGWCPQMEMSVLVTGQKARRSLCQRFSHAGKNAKLLRNSQIIPCPDMTRCSDGIARIDAKRADIRQSFYPGQREPPG